MSYDSKEQSAQDSFAVWLVQAVQGSTTYRYTTIDETLSRSGSSWYASSIDIGDVSSSGLVPRDTLTLKLPYDLPLADTFLGGSPDKVTTITLFRTHYDDTEVRTAWKGRVAGSQIDDKIVVLTCEPIFSSLQRVGPRRVWSRPCPFRLFESPGCNVNEVTYSHALTATAGDGVVITVTGASAYDFIRGTLKTADGVSRMIVDQDGNDVTLIRPHYALLAALGTGSQSVTLAIGCDRTIEDCRDKFNNLNCFGGQPAIPAVNPMDSYVVSPVIK